jgi:hypothetical protein
MIVFDRRHQIEPLGNRSIVLRQTQAAAGLHRTLIILNIGDNRAFVIEQIINQPVAVMAVISGRG